MDIESGHYRQYFDQIVKLFDNVKIVNNEIHHGKSIISVDDNKLGFIEVDDYTIAEILGITKCINYYTYNNNILRSFSPLTFKYSDQDKPDAFECCLMPDNCGDCSIYLNKYSAKGYIYSSWEGCLYTEKVKGIYSATDHCYKIISQYFECSIIRTRCIYYKSEEGHCKCYGGRPCRNRCNIMKVGKRLGEPWRPQFLD